MKLTVIHIENSLTALRHYAISDDPQENAAHLVLARMQPFFDRTSSHFSFFVNRLNDLEIEADPYLTEEQQHGKRFER